MTSPIKSVQEYFEKVIVPSMRVLFLSMFGPKQELPPGPDPQDAPPPASDGHPYRASDPPAVTTAIVPKQRDIMVTCVTRGDADRTKEVVESIKVRTKRRAIRYFKGLGEPGRKGEVRHRVTDRKPDSIEFGYFRRSGKPLHVRWHLEPHAEIQDQK
jgi:hypothetical protein